MTEPAADVSLPTQIAKVFGYLTGLHATHLMAVGIGLGLFRRLARTPAPTPDELAADLELHAPYVRVWCHTAYALELLDLGGDGRFRLAPHMDTLLAAPQATFYVGGFPEAHLQVARDYARYPGLFTTGRSHPYHEHDEAFLRSVAGATRSLPRMFLDAVLPDLLPLAASLDAGATVLDVGCGGGAALVEFAERFPAVRGIGVDVERTSVRLAADRVQERGLDDRIAVHLVDGDDWPVPDATVDVVTSFLVLHEIEPAAN
jgi:Methyltransferase domain